MHDNSKKEIEINIRDIDNYGIYTYDALGNTIKTALEKAIEEEHNLTRAKFKHENLSGVDLTNGKLNDCVFNGCSLVGAKFNGTKCANARFDHVNLNRAEISNQALNGWHFRSSQLTNIDFGELDLTDCVFDGVDFVGSNLSKAKYHISQFENCYMVGVKMKPDPLESIKPIKQVDPESPN